MRGMGGMLTMFGGAAEELEANYEQERTAFLDAKANYEEAPDKSTREELRKVMESAKVRMTQAKDKMNALLKGVGEAAQKAASQLSASAKTAGQKLSAGMKSFGSRLSSGLKSFGSRLSSGMKSIASSVKSKYNKYKEDKKKAKAQAEEDANLAQWNILSKKYGTPSTSSSSDVSSE
jgi:hypothetical protein